MYRSVAVICKEEKKQTSGELTNIKNEGGEGKCVSSINVLYVQSQLFV